MEGASTRRDKLTVGLLFRLSARADTKDDVARFLENDLPAALDGVPMNAWAALRFELLQFGVFVAFSEREGQRAHTGDRVAAALRDQLSDLLAETPRVEGFDLLAGNLAGAPSRVAETPGR